MRWIALMDLREFHHLKLASNQARITITTNGSTWPQGPTTNDFSISTLPIMLVNFENLSYDTKSMQDLLAEIGS